MSEQEPQSSKRSLAISATITAGALLTASLTGIKLYHELNPSDCPVVADDASAEHQVEDLLKSSISAAKHDKSEPKPTDFNLHVLDPAAEPLKSFYAFRARVQTEGESATLPKTEIHASFDQVRKQVASVAIKYGVEIEAPDNASKDSALQTNKVKQSLFAIADYLIELPIETVKRTGLKAVKLNKQVSIDGDSSYLGEVDSKHPGTIELAIPKLNGANGAGEFAPNGLSETVAHELWHVLDYELCMPARTHNIRHDPSFSALNNGVKYGTYPKGAHYFNDSPLEFSRQLITAYQSDPAASCRKLEADTKDIMFATPYSRKNAAEDKAEIGVNIFMPSRYANILSMTQNPYRKKFIKLLSREYVHDPDSAKFLIAQAARLAVRPDIFSCVALED